MTRAELDAWMEGFLSRGDVGREADDEFSRMTDEELRLSIESSHLGRLFLDIAEGRK